MSVALQPHADPAALPLANRNCLVLGGGGFIGLHVCRALAEAGAAVHAFGRNLIAGAALDGIAWTQGTLAPGTPVDELVRGQDVVFHLIGMGLPETSNANPASTLSASLLATVDLLEACRRQGVRRIVFASSGGTVYGVARALPIPETAPTDPISAYGINKLAIEKYLALYEFLYGLEYVALRLGNPYGPFQLPERRQGVVAGLLAPALRDEPVEVWGDGSVVRDFVHVSDVAAAFVAAAQYRGARRVFNVGSGVGRSVADVVADIARTLGRRALKLRSKPGRRADVPANVLDISLIGREMGWSPAVPWNDGLRETARWLDSREPRP